MIDAGEPRLDAVLTADPKEAWQTIFPRLWEVFSPPLSVQHVERELAQRGRHVAGLELLLSRSAWELWNDFEKSAPRTAPSLIDFWNPPPPGKAVLILDALSLRETPWLLQDAKR